MCVRVCVCVCADIKYWYIYISVSVCLLALLKPWKIENSFFLKEIHENDELILVFWEGTVETSNFDFFLSGYLCECDCFPPQSSYSFEAFLALRKVIFFISALATKHNHILSPPSSHPPHMSPDAAATAASRSENRVLNAVCSLSIFSHITAIIN